MVFASSLQGLDFEMRKLYNETAEGESIDYYFTGDGRRIFYRPPILWSWRGTSAEFIARAPSPSDGRLSLRAIAPVKTLPVPGSQESLSAYPAHFAQQLPQGALGVRVLEIACDTIGGRKIPATRATFSYEFKGNARFQTLIYAAYRNHCWIEIRIDSHKTDFPAVQAAGLLSLQGFTEELRAPEKNAAAE